METVDFDVIGFEVICESSRALLMGGPGFLRPAGLFVSVSVCLRFTWLSVWLQTADFMRHFFLRLAPRSSELELLCLPRPDLSSEIDCEMSKSWRLLECACLDWTIFLTPELAAEPACCSIEPAF